MKTIIVCDQCKGENVRTEMIEQTERKTMTQAAQERRYNTSLTYKPNHYVFICADCGHTVEYQA
jgi:rubrerythrin